MIGRKVIRNDGPAKVTGHGVYGADLRLPNQLYAACRYTDIVCGHLLTLDLTVARNTPGVVAIATGADIPGDWRVGAIRKDQPVLIRDRIAFTGDVLAVVAAETQETAWAAADRIEAKYRPDPGLFDLEAAAQPDAPLVHPEFGDNVVVHYPLRKGDVEAGFSVSERFIERTFRTGFQEHAYIEPETVTAEPDPLTGGVKLYGSIQNPFSTRRIVAGCLGLKLNQVIVIPSLMGGSFGGKDDILSIMACRVALLAMMTGRPVQLVNSRENSFRESYKRHPYVMRYKVGFSNAGKIEAMAIDILADSGAYAGQSFFVTWRSVVQATGPYVIPNVSTDIRAIYTNNPYTGAFRGFGAPQVIFAVESLLDEMASICGLNPLAIRELNGFRQGAITASGQVLSGHTVSLMEALHTAAERSHFLQKWNTPPGSGRYRRGIGLAVSYRGCSLGAEGVDATSAVVTVQADGSVNVVTALHENGQGLQTTFCQIVAEVLGCELCDVRFIEPQTAMIADGGPTVASRSTLMGGQAVKLASEKVRSELLAAAANHLGSKELSPGEWHRKLGFAETVALAMKEGRCLAAYGWFKGPDATWDEHTGQGSAYFTYVYGCQVAEVRVDTLTGRIETLAVTAVHDVGKVINRLGATGQVTGGVVQSVGYGVFEDYSVKKGRNVPENFDEYLLPTAADAPTIDVTFLENPDPYGPYGAKSLGEPAFELGATAVANAVAHALGRRFYEIPLTLERIVVGHRLERPERESEKTVVKGKNTASLSQLEISTPDSLEHALELLGRERYTVLAGGTDVFVRLRKSNRPAKLLNLSNLSELCAYSIEGRHLCLGGGMTISALRKAVKTQLPLLYQAAGELGSLQIRNRATLAGNLVNAAPCADTVPSLLVADAEVELRSQRETRRIPLSEFIVGQYHTLIHHDELLTRVLVPLYNPAEYHQRWFKLGRRAAVNIGRMSVAAALRKNGNKLDDVRLALGAVWSRPMRILALEDFLTGRIWNAETRFEAEALLLELIQREAGGRWSSPYKIPVAVGLAIDVLADCAR